MSTSNETEPSINSKTSCPPAASRDNDLLNLFLRANTNNNTPRLDCSVWDFLTLRDLYQLRSVSKFTFSALEMVEYNRCRDGNDYLVPFPAYPGVLSTRSDINVGSGLFTHQLSSLRAMHRAENNNTTFGALRGGILGDAPGLGKTITMLGLIGSTSGLRPVEPKEFYDNESIDEHWKLMRTNPVFRPEILRALKPFRDSHLYGQLALDVSPPYKDDRFPTLASFEQYVNKAMRLVVPQTQLDLFRRSVTAFKAGLDRRNRRFFSNEKGKRMLFERNLIPCSTTLIVVPDALLEHWAEQIRGHFNLGVFVDPNNGGGSNFGVVYIDGVGDLSTARFPLNHQQMSMPSAFDLMSHMIAVVPFSRIKQQYSNARKRRRAEDGIDSESYASSSPLLQLRWFRIVVDEGHELGENEASGDVTSFINEMGAERRWVMSGTPTTGDEDSQDFTAKGLDQLQRLLFFLRHEKYGTLLEPMGQGEYNSKAKGGRGKRNKQQAKSAWEACVKKPFLKKQGDGRKELYQVLDEVMVMHKKEDLSLPKPIFKQPQVSVPVPSDVQATIIDAVLSKDCNPTEALDKIGILHRQPWLSPAFKTGGKALFDTLLSEYMGTNSFQEHVDEAQAKFIVGGVKKERLDLEHRGGAVLDGITAPITAATNPTRFLENWVERRPIKAVVYSNSHNNLLSVAEYLYGAFDNESIAELVEGKIDHMSYELGRFRHNYKEGKNCPICGGWNDYTGKKLTSCNNRLLEVSDGENTYLLEPERIIRAVGQVEFNSSEDMLVQQLGNPVENNRLEGAPLTKYGISLKHWRVGDVLCIDARDPHPLLQKRWSKETWAAYGSEQCVELAESDGQEGRDNYFGPLPSDDEYMASRQVMVRLKKWQPCGRFHSRPRWDARRGKQVGWYKGPTLEDIEMRKQKEDTFILLLDASLSHGLDLSFVTHMFLLEPIDDAALLEQVTSRAHRLGCTGPVTIETINVWQQMDSTTKEFAKQLSSTVQDEAKERTSTSICEHCYRSFPNLEKALLHELTCDRNPDGNAKIDPYHLSSVYRDIRPPAPMIVRVPDSKNNERDTKE
mmetsp:Transcript_30569/g.64684  ORF Transcript_30569/g.64684 Transcript_30569/m.64684 type:complete len:1068 (-) Transcript_30569:106-3309(-)|eukprot:CAMPEP_0172322804 /NCGR_PEP_ID=MMETSP1058-20130122/46958_1 /TAXON_ID=83371 /ORGANISM="Detonula confervacea, Strain CCMP 353" /LENGTH=1067 /DNA_ID=CAMNT_0013038647 /DNA_START=146 /DNA_END=3349 /DNA_ORIENTATION=+